MQVMKPQTKPVRIIRAFSPDIGILQRKTRFHPVRARFTNQQPATTQQLTPTALQTPNFQYSINPERHDVLPSPFQNTVPKPLTNSFKEEPTERTENTTLPSPFPLLPPVQTPIPPVFRRTRRTPIVLELRVFVPAQHRRLSGDPPTPRPVHMSTISAA